MGKLVGNPPWLVARPCLLLKLPPAGGLVCIPLQLAVGPRESWNWLFPHGSLGCVLVLTHWWAWPGHWLASCEAQRKGPRAGVKLLLGQAGV